MTKRFAAALVCLLILISLSALADITYSITLSSSYISLAPGASQKISYAIAPVNLTEHTVTWTSENPYVASVDSKGVITAHAAGTTKVSCTIETGSTKHVTVAVTGNPVRYITLDLKEVEIEAGGKYQMEYTIDPTADDQRVKWSSSDTTVATVTSGGLVTAVSGGTAEITVTAVNGLTSNAMVYVPSDVKRIELDPADAYITPGETLQLEAYIYPGNARGRTLTWASNNESVAVVDENGVVTAVGEGNCLIRAAAENGVYAVSAIHSVKLPSSIEILDKVVVLTKQNRTKKLSLDYYPADTNGCYLTWETSDKSVAEVSNGTVTANGYGVATIYATALNGVRSECTVYVCEYPESVAFESKVYSVQLGGIPVNTSTVFSPADSWELGGMYTVDDEKIANVSSDGVITANKPGSCTLTVTYPSGISASAKITVYENATGIFLKSDHIYMQAGSIQPVKIYTNTGNEYTSTITASSDTASVAVWSNGYVMAKTQGTALITLRAVTGNLSCSLAVTVYAAPLSAKSKTVALTFDNGPSEHTGEILNVLSTYGVKATFFLLGKSVEALPQYAALLRDTEHEIGNHTYNNNSVSSQSASQTASQINQTDSLIKSATGRQAAYLRVPDARIPASLVDSFLDARRYVGRGIDLGDMTLDAEEVAANALAKCYDTAILTLHDNGKSTVEALEILIPELIIEGYRFVTISELIEITGSTQGVFSTAR